MPSLQKTLTLHHGAPPDNQTVAKAYERWRAQQGNPKNGCDVQGCPLHGKPTEWAGRTIRLQLDHINGNSHDCRPWNLRFVCPNCHSQTPTYAGRNAGRIRGVTPGGEVLERPPWEEPQASPDGYACLEKDGTSTKVSKARVTGIGIGSRYWPGSK